MSDVASALQRLASYRANHSRASQDVFKKGDIVLKSGKAPKGEEGWAFLEQLALAAIDLDRLEVADACIAQLANKFPDSPRVDVLTGIRIEATEPLDIVLSYYRELLQKDSTNAAAWKRKISVLRQKGGIDQATEELIQYLDTFYTDPEAWLELADIYVTNRQYTSGLQALSHALALNPQNPFTFVQFAETAYSAGDLPLALKMFLVAVDMIERDLDSPQTTPPTGLAIRAWWGVKLCSRHLLETPSLSTSPSNTKVPKSLSAIDELATERVLVAYKGEEAAPQRRLVEKWLSSK
ncbi:tetratricopeptide repeat domain 35 [Coprinopsis cinerea okayama7|uniref:ER membrane protein complex subunit 2 n=1 Tax=Coprinopsis cinerea (strain Okayama-7 / 130 / ATCC MYA-4618 / FGSC 9003) TaxID=240176 RepID=A8NZZ5_COPC7|nr:tetratricopeptide repeat domain 35 [Coprinopsis cinerea okayama7\|eukprot:XP_001837784.1 tetratricopeptide repeat domain 35 [Coprinopsis cinerea okayama7\